MDFGIGIESRTSTIYGTPQASGEEEGTEVHEEGAEVHEEGTGRFLRRWSAMTVVSFAATRQQGLQHNVRCLQLNAKPAAWMEEAIDSASPSRNGLFLFFSYQNEPPLPAAAALLFYDRLNDVSIPCQMKRQHVRRTTINGGVIIVPTKWAAEAEPLLATVALKSNECTAATDCCADEIML